MISASLVFENKIFTDTYEFSLVKAVNDTLIFAEEIISDGKNTFELSRFAPMIIFNVSIFKLIGCVSVPKDLYPEIFISFNRDLIG